MNINVQHLLIKKLQSTNNKLLDAVQTFDENLSSSNTTQDVSSEVFDNVINLVEKQDHLMQYIEQDGGAVQPDPLQTAINGVKQAATNAKQAFESNQETITIKEDEIKRLNEQIKSLKTESERFAKNSEESKQLKLQIESVNGEKTNLTNQIANLNKENAELQKQKQALEDAKVTTIKQLQEVLQIMTVFLPKPSSS